QLVTAGVTTPNQTLTQLGTFNGPATGGWGLNRLLPLMDAGGNVARVPLSGQQTLRYTASNGDYDFLAVVPVVPTTAQIRINTVSVTGGMVTINWTGGGTLEWATSLAPPIQWTPTGNSS